MNMSKLDPDANEFVPAFFSTTNVEDHMDSQRQQSSINTAEKSISQACLKRFPTLKTLTVLPEGVTNWTEFEKKLDEISEQISRNAEHFVKPYEDHRDRDDYEDCLFRCKHKFRSHGFETAEEMWEANTPEVQFVKEYRRDYSQLRNVFHKRMKEKADKLVDLCLQGSGASITVKKLDARSRLIWHKLAENVRPDSSFMRRVTSTTFNRRGSTADMKLSCV